MLVTFDKPWKFHLTNGATFTLPPGEWIFEPDGRGQPGWFDVFTVKGEHFANIHVEGTVMS